MTPAEKAARFAKLQKMGCVCCLMNYDRLCNGVFVRTGQYAEIHHLNGGGHHGQKRRGHEFTIPLCEWHHRGNGPTAEYTDAFGPSWAKGSKPFRAVYGTDDELLALVNSLIEPIPYEIPEAK